MVRAWLLTAVVVVALALPAPAATPACIPSTTDATRVHLGQLDDDGELTSLRERIVGVGGEVCEEEREPTQLDVTVAILHRDADGSSLEGSELTRADGPVRTRVTVRDTTAEARHLEVAAPTGMVMATRRIGVPQLVRATVRYPASWEVEAPSGDGISTRLDGDALEVARTAVLFPPLLEGSLTLEVTANPGRGTPRVTVDATPLAGSDAFALAEKLVDRDTTAVVGALLELTGEGVRELAAGAEELAAGTDELADGAAQIAGGAGELADGTAGLADGIGGLSAGIGQSAAGARELAAGADELADGTRQVAAGTGQLAEGADALAAGAREFADELAVIRDVDEAIEDALGDAEVDPDALAAAVDELAERIRAVRDELAAVVPPDTDPTDPEDPHAPVARAVAILTELADAMTGLAEGLGAALERLVEVYRGILAIPEGADQLADGAAELAAGIAELEGAMHGLADGAGALAAGTHELAGGLAQLEDGAGELATGAGQLADGARGLAAGTDGLATGTRELATGAGALAEGAGQVPEAVAEILGIADRGGDRAAVTEAVLDAGAGRAVERRGDAALVTTQLVHHGRSPVPVLLLTIGAIGLLAVALASTWLWRRRGALP